MRYLPENTPSSSICLGVKSGQNSELEIATGRRRQHIAIALLHLVVDGDDATPHPAFLSVQEPNRAIQHRGEGHPGGVGCEQPRRHATLPPGHDQEGEDSGEQQQDHEEREPDPVGGEEDRRPKEIENELRRPQLHRPAAAIALEGAPAGHRDQDIEHGPDRGEHPVRRVEGRLGEAGIPFARRGQEADGKATADNEKQEQAQRTKAFH